MRKVAANVGETDAATVYVKGILTVKTIKRLR